MGAGDWVSGGLRRAVTGVRSALPGQGEQEPAEEPAAVPVVEAEGPAAETSAPVGPVAATAPASAPASMAVARGATAARKAPAAKEGPARRAPAKGAPAPVPAEASAPVDEAPALPVPTWSEDELAGFRVALEADINRLREELNMGAADMADLLSDAGDSAGDDQADAGSKTLEREQEMSVNANARDLLDQSTHALRRLEAGTYGLCESCGTVIPAARLRAFPRATLCIACKQADERR